MPKDSSDPKLKVASIQMCPTFKDKMANIKRLIPMIVKAAKAGAKLIILPELCTTGYGFMSETEAAPFSEPLTDDFSLIIRPDSPHYTQAVMMRIARLYNVTIVWGMMEVDPESGDLHNSVVLMSPDEIHVVRKINPFGNDYIWSRPGTEPPPIIESKHLGKTIGLLVCRDVRNKSEDLDKFYTDSGKRHVDIVCLCANWGDGGFPATAWMDFVRNTKSNLVVSNRYGYECPNDFGEGGACIITSDMRVQCEGLVWSQDCIVVGEI